MSTNQNQSNKLGHSYELNNEAYREKSNASKATNAGKAYERSQYEQRTIDFIKKHSDLPMVAFAQGFAAGESGVVKGLPTDFGIEPALADIRLERIHQKNPAQVHIEVTGTNAPMYKNSEFYIKIEKLHQQIRTNDNKLFMCVYPQFRENGTTKSKAVMIRIPTKDLKSGGALDITGSASELRKRYPDDKSGPGGCRIRTVDGQLMLTMPSNTRYRLTREEFIGHIEKSLNRAHYDGLSPEKKAADAAFHNRLSEHKEQLKELNDEYIKQRGALTLAGNRVNVLSDAEKQQLNKIAVLNRPELVSAYRNEVRQAGAHNSLSPER